MENANPLHWNFERVRCDLGHDRLKALPNGGGSDIHVDCAVRCDLNSGIFSRTGSPSFYEAADTKAVISPVDHLSDQAAFFFPCGLLDAAIECDSIVAAVAGDLPGSIVRQYRCQFVGH